MSTIIQSNTHYTITDYNLGDNDRLEKFVSIPDENFRKFDPLYTYDEDTKSLYIPRGVDPSKLEALLKAGMRYENVVGGRKVTFSMKLTPRNKTQRRAIRFLTGADEYNYTKNATQLVLSLPSGGGKTYCAVAALSIFGLASLIITHTDDIRTQWKDRILEYSNVPESSIVLLNSSETIHKYMEDSKEIKRKIKDEVVYIATHSLLRTYAKQYGFDSLDLLFQKLGIGVKIVDEAHKEFFNTIEIDNQVSVYKNIYLTATFARTDRRENIAFQRVFQDVYKLTVSDKEMGVTQNVIYITELFSTGAKPVDIYGMRNGRGPVSKFSIYKYIDYALAKNTIVESFKSWLSYFIEKNPVDGVILVISPKKDSCKYFMEIAKEMYPDKKCCIYNSDSKVDNVEEYDIVCSTAKMFGTGNDINRLKVMINMEPIGSKINVYQIFHRLMRGNDEELRYYVDLIDKSVTNVYEMYKRCKPTLESAAKKHIVMDRTKIK